VNHPLDYLALAAAGGLGVLLRAGCNTLAVRLAGPTSTWAAPATTLTINVAGSFLFGLLYALMAGKPGLGPAWQTIVLVGLLGGFTTYSTFAFQAIERAGHGHLAGAIGYVAATNVLALIAVWVGLRLPTG